MFSFLFSLCLSEDHYISFNDTSQPFVPTVTEHKMWSIVNTTDFVAVLVAPSNKFEIIQQHIAFSGASSLFMNNGPFLYVDATNPLKLTQKYLVTPPALFLFKNHSLWLACPYPMNEVSLLFTLKRFFSQTVDTVDEMKDLYATLGCYRFSLITSPDLLEKTLDLRFKVAPYLGAMDVIVTSRKNMNLLNVSALEICLFRLEDHALQPFEPDFNAFFEVAEPVFKQYIYDDLVNSPKTIVAMMSDELITEQEEYLYDMALKYPSLQFGFLSRDLRFVAERACLLSFQDGDNFIAFDPVYQGFYPNEKYKSYCFQYPFSRGDYNRSFTNYFDEIVSGKLKIQYHCENLTEEDESGLVKKLNANNYEHFLRNRVADLVVLYLRTTLDDNSYYINLLNLAAEKLKENNVTNVRFAYINTFNNTGQYHYPHILEYPSLRFYPHQNQSESIVFAHDWSSDDIARFICRCTRPPIKDDFLPRKDEKEFKSEAGRFVKYMYSYNKRDSDRLTEYFRKMWLELDIPVGIKLENEAFPRDDPQLKEMEVQGEEIEGWDNADDDPLKKKKQEKPIEDIKKEFENIDAPNKEL
ncbi:hypothetical protein TVAG_254870 [Trichomonas vaginalis G3]|uniref:Thioredoxin domain-containing protein n=1 Tax=Trichomonas vaginalis (strain ATCC PRA-98 / G3) TaxID=412133 RepID=A2EXM9_TRIV3|nr:intramolecular oxidoreductase activity, transposing S-S bonds [Trichomonas vaginalis G3]EAY02586.1 hypothetical protein TVAG_254870 [Trichomonas vaginalis G3]KAI5512568.1 intramolecular oxidoreductase activity, transposing S-S bonds [Trichomonas vaginalis G3]|eukprot:XP_001314809.1 hypothetical protein [Trichomonas vaginalis G3]